MLLGRGASSKLSGFLARLHYQKCKQTIQFFVNNPSFLKFAVAQQQSEKLKGKTREILPGQVVFILSWLVLLPESLKQAK